MARVISTKFLRRLPYFSLVKHVCNAPRTFFLSTPLFSLNEITHENLKNIDLNLQDACRQGESALLEQMQQFENKIHELSKDYKECLKKQIEIIEAATRAGSTSSKWDDLPEYRIMASALKQQLEFVVSAVNTLGQIAQNEQLKYITQQEKLLEILDRQHKELDNVIRKHMNEIKELENVLLIKSRDSIKFSK